MTLNNNDKAHSLPLFASQHNLFTIIISSSRTAKKVHQESIIVIALSAHHFSCLRTCIVIVGLRSPSTPCKYYWSMKQGVVLRMDSKRVKFSLECNTIVQVKVKSSIGKKMKNFIQIYPHNYKSKQNDQVVYWNNYLFSVMKLLVDIFLTILSLCVENSS